MSQGYSEHEVGSDVHVPGKGLDVSEFTILWLNAGERRESI